MDAQPLQAGQSESRPLVLVAMSGGVDSAVAAACVQADGYPLLGVTMKLWDYAEVGGRSEARDGRCCSLEDIAGARSSAEVLGIPYYVMDLKSAFRDTVIADFVEEYRSGRTPNPCIVCNQRVKWTALYDRARQVGADLIATGHYARRVYNEKSGRWELWRGVDPSRDQSYVLYGLTQAQLARTLFPLGGMLKSEVRERARTLGLPVADKAESREICFVTDDDYRRFLRERLGDRDPATAPGPLLDEQGERVGEHNGYAFFTVGQRRGFRLSRGQPYYVRHIDPATRSVHIAPGKELFSDTVTVEQVNWVSAAPSDHDIAATVKIRYQHAGAPARIRPTDDGRVCVRFCEPQRALTPGQSAVFYDGDRVLGGGRIASEPGMGGHRCQP